VGWERKENFSRQKPYTKFFGGKKFSATRVVFSGNNSYQKTSTRVTKNFEMWVVQTKNVDVLYLCRLAIINLGDLRVPPWSS
jgi:hypothetical protein